MYIRSHTAAKVISLAVQATGGRPVIFLGEIPPGAGEVRVPTACSGGFGYWLIDASVDEAGRTFLIEANPTNGAADSIIDGGVGRVLHMVESLLARVPDPVGGVAVLGHQDRFHHVPEFYARVLAFTDQLESRGVPVAVANAGEKPYVNALTILTDDIPRLAPLLDVSDSGSMTYQGCPVVFVTNPNLLPALVRAGRCTSTGGVDTSVFHEGALARLGQDKALQQDVAVDTVFTPLRHAEARNLDEAEVEVLRIHAEGVAAVVKTHDTSGGAGVEIMKPDVNVRGCLERQLAAVVERYGPGTERTVFPLRVFEYAQSILVPHRGGLHIWDCRVEVQVRPDYVTARPAQVRICPEPFDGSFSRGSVVSNVSGRPASTDFMLGPDELFKRLVPTEARARLLQAAATWAVRAERWRAEPDGPWRHRWDGCRCQQPTSESTSAST
jgi:hypothetical protein